MINNLLLPVFNSHCATQTCYRSVNLISYSTDDMIKHLMLMLNLSINSSLFKVNMYHMYQHTHTYIHTHVHTHTHTHMCTHTHTHTCTCAHTHTHTHTYTYVCKHTYTGSIQFHHPHILLLSNQQIKKPPAPPTCWSIQQKPSVRLPWPCGWFPQMRRTTSRPLWPRPALLWLPSWMCDQCPASTSRWCTTPWTPPCPAARPHLWCRTCPPAPALHSQLGWGQLLWGPRPVLSRWCSHCCLRLSVKTGRKRRVSQGLDLKVFTVNCTRPPQFIRTDKHCHLKPVPVHPDGQTLSLEASASSSGRTNTVTWGQSPFKAVLMSGSILGWDLETQSKCNHVKSPYRPESLHSLR